MKGGPTKKRVNFGGHEVTNQNPNSSSKKIISHCVSGAQGKVGLNESSAADHSPSQGSTASRRVNFGSVLLEEVNSLIAQGLVNNDEMFIVSR
ncbi:hypothetical protein PMIT1306_01642 [Prochlorococcus sp. MIT 1306]|nr:hypothetical protein PMIT1306_01642 [Prochlorococcus sp. MIT 1306]